MRGYEWGRHQAVARSLRNFPPEALALPGGWPFAPGSVAAMADVPGGLIEFDDDGHVTEFGGLGLEPSPQGLIVRGETLYSRCVLDSLFIPETSGSCWKSCPGRRYPGNRFGSCSTKAEPLICRLRARWSHSRRPNSR